MAANLTYNSRGEAQMFYFGETPWHAEGYSLSEAERRDFDAVFGKIEFDYPLEKLPYYRPGTVIPSGDGGNGQPLNWIPATDTFYVRRKDTGAIFGTVGGSYEIVTNRTAFGTLKPLVDGGIATIETGGVLREGADAWLMVKWDVSRFGDEARELFDSDGGVIPYSAAMVNHNGRRGIMLGNTPIRVVCSNTLAMAETDRRSRWVMIDHRAGAGERLVAAAEEMFSGVIQRYEVIAKQYKLLRQTYLTDEVFGQLVLDAIAPLPENNKRFNPEAPMAHIVRERIVTKRNTVADLWTGGKGHTGEKTAWYALNAAYEAIDHNRELWPTRAGSWRTAKLLTGDLAKMKDKIVDSLVEYAAGVA